MSINATLAAPHHIDGSSNECSVSISKLQMFNQRTSRQVRELHCKMYRHCMATNSIADV
jgi:hypothetical protein